MELTSLKNSKLHSHFMNELNYRRLADSKDLSFKFMLGDLKKLQALGTKLAAFRDLKSPKLQSYRIYSNKRPTSN